MCVCVCVCVCACDVCMHAGSVVLLLVTTSYSATTFAYGTRAAHVKRATPDPDDWRQPRWFDIRLFWRAHSVMRRGRWRASVKDALVPY